MPTVVLRKVTYLSPLWAEVRSKQAIPKKFRSSVDPVDLGTF